MAATIGSLTKLKSKADQLEAGLPAPRSGCGPSLYGYSVSLRLCCTGSQRAEEGGGLCGGAEGGGGAAEAAADAGQEEGPRRDARRPPATSPSAPVAPSFSLIVCRRRTPRRHRAASLSAAAVVPRGQRRVRPRGALGALQLIVFRLTIRPLTLPRPPFRPRFVRRARPGSRRGRLSRRELHCCCRGRRDAREGRAVRFRLWLDFRRVAQRR